jgi:hypothetical protein
MKKILKEIYPNDIYSKDLILRAIADYSKICTIQVLPLKKGYVCLFSNSITDLSITQKEFSNYLIELYMEQHRGSRNL